MPLRHLPILGKKRASAIMNYAMPKTIIFRYIFVSHSMGLASVSLT